MERLHSQKLEWNRSIRRGSPTKRTLGGRAHWRVGRSGPPLRSYVIMMHGQRTPPPPAEAPKPRPRRRGAPSSLTLRWPSGPASRPIDDGHATCPSGHARIPHRSPSCPPLPSDRLHGRMIAPRPPRARSISFRSPFRRLLRAKLADDDDGHPDLLSDR
jgi:hypothetical protein